MQNAFVRSLAALFGLAAAVVAQTQPHLVGITRNTPQLHHRDHANCTVLANCPPLGFPNAVTLPPYAGGTAWDPTRSGAWITNGQVLAKVDDNCNYVCPLVPILFPNPNTVITGLEVVESLTELWMTDNTGMLHRYTLGCPPFPIGACNTGLVPQQPNWSTSGLAVDEGLGLVFIAYADFVTQTNLIVVSQLANPCVPLQRIPVAAPCTIPFRAITGLAVNWCARVLYATDGVNTIGMDYAPGFPLVTINNTTCCLPNGVTEPMIGLAVRPGRPTRFGQPCASGACLPCAMTHQLINDPNLGNFQFALSVNNAPSGSLAWVLIGAGPCTAPGTVVPPLCGPVFLPTVLGSLGPMPAIGTGGCTGNAVFNMGLPVIPSLCGQIISSQGVAICSAATGAIGTAVSNCLTFQLQGN